MDTTENPATESYLHLSQDADSDDATSHAAQFDTSELMDLAKKIDEIEVDLESPIKLPHISSQSTPKKARISLDELTKRLRPMINQEFEQFRHTLQQLLESPAKVDSSSDDSKPPSPTPGTTPPHSQDNLKESTLLDDFDSYMPAIRNSEVDRLKAQLAKATAQAQSLQRHNAELKLANTELTIKLKDSKQYGQELRNEITFIRGSGSAKQEPTPTSSQADTDALRAQITTLQAQIASLQAQVSDLQAQIGDDVSISEDTVDPKFRVYYAKLGLAQVDELTKVKMANVLKNLTLTLMFSRFDQLPQNVVRLSKFVRMAGQFLDHLHELLYGAQEFKPSMYLRSDVPVTDLQQCLDAMHSQLVQYVKE